MKKKQNWSDWRDVSKNNGHEREMNDRNKYKKKEGSRKKEQNERWKKNNEQEIENVNSRNERRERY